MSNELMLYLGAAVLALALAAAILTAVLLHISGARLRKKLAREYGALPKASGHGWA